MTRSISAKAIMFQGTGSDVGKSVLVAGLCRALKLRGFRSVPFKPQNMSNNAAVADPEPDGSGGGEIGRAQWLQALAAGVPPSVHMNPVLLKPQSESGSQIVVQGKVTGNAKAREYWSLKPHLLEKVMESYFKVCEHADFVIIEGAGSPAEINLRDGDIANMGFAREAEVPVVLVGDINRGGVIASIVGTHTILPEEDRAMIAGFVINKFRGDVSLFDEGLAAITRFTGWPAFGVLPWLDPVGRLPAEDSVALDGLSTRGGNGPVIAVPVLGRIANFDDLDPLRLEPGISVKFVRKGQRLPDEAAMVVLPGSKSTLADLAEFRANGWDQELLDYVAGGGRVIGLCGGYQMLGKSISDPLGIEGEAATVEGLGLLDIETVLEPEKITRNTHPVSLEFDVRIEGYEIHMGRTAGPDCARPMIQGENGPDGAISASGRVRGCYLHGLFNSDEYRRRLLAELGFEASPGGYRQQVETALDELSQALERHLDIDRLIATAAGVRRS